MLNNGLPVTDVVGVSVTLGQRRTVGVGTGSDSALAAQAAAENAAGSANRAEQSKNGADAKAQDAINELNRSLEDMQNAIRNSGYTPVDSFEDGFVLTNISQALRLKSNNAFYSWRGDYPKTVPAHSTPETTGGFTPNAWVDVNDLTLRSDLKAAGAGRGGYIVALEQGGTTGDAIKYVNIFSEGAKGDYDPDTGTGTNDLPAIINAVEKAKQNGYLEVQVPAGYDYFLDRTQTGPINLGGIGFEGDNSQAGARGVKLVSVGQGLARFFVKSPDEDTVCIINTGGSGSFTSRGVDGITFIAHPSTRGKGVAYENRDSCGTLSYNCIATDMYAAVMLHNKRQTSFTEFNRFIGWRFHNCRYSVIFKITDGDNSFHGTEFISSQMQMYIDPLNPINSGSGIKTDIPAGRRGHIYHSRFDIRAFGGPGCKLLDIGSVTCDNSFGTMTCEGDFILKCTDDSWWHVHGDLIYYNGVMTIDAPVPPRLGVPATFIFSNRGGPFGNFTDTTLADCKPSLYDPNAADRMLGGSYPYIGRMRGNGVDSLFIAIPDDDRKGFNFVTVPPGGRLEDAVRRWGWSSNGASFKGYSDTVYVNNNTTGVMLTTDGFTNRNSKQLYCGTAAYPWLGGYFQNAPNVTSDERLKSRPRIFTENEILAFYFIGKLPGFWQWIQRLQEEGNDARLHSGPTVQACIAIMEKYGLVWSEYGAFGYDEWPEQPEVFREWEAEPAVYEIVPGRAAVIENGVVVTEAIPDSQVVVKKAIEAGRELVQEYKPAGNEYKLRKDELMWAVHYATTVIHERAMESLGAVLPVMSE